MGTTYLFTDIEGSTRSWSRDQGSMSSYLMLHDELMRRNIETCGGLVVKHTGDGVFAVFRSAVEGLECAVALQGELAALEDFGHRVRMGLHTGPSERRGEDYFGPSVNMAQRIMDAAGGAQIVVSEAIAREMGAVTGPVKLIDLGVHRLRDLGDPTRLFLVTHPGLPSDAALPPRTLSCIPNNLMRPLTPFIGREREMQQLRLLLRDGDTRLLTLHGPGGTGKTRLALHTAAMEAVSFPDGVYFVELEGVRVPEQIPGTVADALELDIARSDDIDSVVTSHLSCRRALLVLDNYEHLSPDTDFIRALLGRCGELKMMVTSRNRLRLSGEHVYPVRGLDLPDGASGRTSDSELLFAETARRLGRAPADNEGETVRNICRILSGNPLAIILAASWTGMLTPHEILEEMGGSLSVSSDLEDLPDRHRSLRDVFMFSWRILGDEEHRALSKLTVFHGGFIREAALEICDLGLSQLAGLSGKSLLERNEDGAFSIPPLLREFALEMSGETLSSDETGKLLRRHSEYYLGLVSVHSRDLVSGNRTVAARTLAGSLEDILGAWEWAIGNRLHREAADACEGLRTLLGIRGLYRQGLELFRKGVEVLEGLPGEQALELRGRLLSGMGWFSSYYESGTASTELLRRSAEILSTCDAPEALANTLNMLGNVLFVSGVFDRACEAYLESLQLRRELGDGPGVAAVLNNLGNLACQRKEYDEARRFYGESLVLDRGSGNQHGVSSTLSNLAIVAIALGEHENARELLTEALEIERMIDDRFNVAIVQGIMCDLCLDRDELDEAEALCRENISTYGELGNAWGLAESCGSLAEVHYRRSDFRDAAEALLAAIGHLHCRDWSPLALVILGRAAGLLHSSGRFDRASSVAEYVAGHVSCSPGLAERMGEIMKDGHCETSDDSPPSLDGMLREVERDLSELLRNPAD
ncbi:MAG: hypothetical protein AVO35_02520 [Candidatus Aegiribacteria sp. MLS_C]|nr:MAG: hypothetical protein AVO35_02520 [Candidatus Aegiribacteria sp. MLS_C]